MPTPPRLAIAADPRWRFPANRTAWLSGYSSGFLYDAAKNAPEKLTKPIETGAQFPAFKGQECEELWLSAALQV